MRTIRTIFLTLIMLVTSVSISPVAHATSGGGSEVQSEPRSKPLPSTPSKWKTIYFKMGPSIKYWQKVAQCETAGNWKDGGNFSGGLGIAQSTWEGYGGLDFAPRPSKATMLEQILVANRAAVFGYQTKNEFRTLEDKQLNKPFFRPAVGFYGWGCIKHNRYLRPPNSGVYYVKLPQGSQFYCPEFEPLFKKYDLPWKVFSYIAWRESRCNPAAFNQTLNKDGSTDSGLLQINSSWHKTLRDVTGYDMQDLLNPNVNVMFASWILHFTSGRLKNWNVHAASV